MLLESLTALSLLVQLPSTDESTVLAKQLVAAARMDTSAIEGAKLAFQQEYKSGKYTKQEYECLIDLPSNEIREAITETYARALTPTELSSAIEFFRSTSGNIYLQVSFSKLLTLTGELSPNLKIEVTDQVLSDVKAFVATNAGEQTTKLTSPAMQEAGAKASKFIKMRWLHCAEESIKRKRGL